MRLQHHNRASLLAGKLHAILQRKYVKGRDLYDLVWYLSDPAWPLPNFDMLENALRQTGWEGLIPTQENWKKIFFARLQNINIQSARADVSPFLERAGDIDLIALENLASLLNQE